MALLRFRGWHGMVEPKNLTELLKQLIGRLEPIAVPVEKPVRLDSRYGFDECVTYCWDCAREEIAWTRWQLRLCLWAAFEYGDSHGRELKILGTLETDYPVRINYCRQALLSGWKLSRFIWKKGNDLRWWAEGKWIMPGTEKEYYYYHDDEILPNSTSFEHDGIEVCECCAKVLEATLY